MLLQLLQNGSPGALMYGFAVFQAVNSLSCVPNVLTDRFSALTEVLIDSIFDWSCAVLYPIATLLYCYHNFDFDRDVYMTYLEKLPAGSFEHLARAFADPSEIALFRVSFDSLRINSFLDFVVRIGMNLAYCYRFERVLEVLVLLRHREIESNGVLKLARVQRPTSHQKPVPKALTAVFVLFSLAIILSSHKAISDSTQLCSVHPECVVFVYRWKSSDEHCLCLVLIDIDNAPKTYDEWIHPIDAFDTVKASASSGMLVSLQVTNRQLVEWPEELRKCQNLRAM
ncbi:hypothetical protein V7S43_004078 [Phytophthora oleae]|uniref:Uncharacterized protein n=1 Tax=Phytophthora oleae TaxID=2107226 RepID=A0ABD3FVF5_9STRA